MVARYYLPLILLGLMAFAGRATAAETFQDCSDCPIMVKLPSGTFAMGSSWEETRREGAKDKDVADEHPQHAVRISKGVALGQFAVTRGEFAVFVRETGVDPSGCYVYAGGKFNFEQERSWRNPGFVQSDRHPVVCVSFEDAQRYAQWLSRKTGKSYRLPTEAEWEYAARAGTTTARFWGDGRAHACDFANVADLTGAAALDWPKGDNVFQCRDGYAYTAPVGSFRPNPFGLYDMLGNVWQWTEDCHHNSYKGSPSDGSAWIGGECNFRVLRGGSWGSGPASVRAASRNGVFPVDRSYEAGFRLARTVTH